MADHKLSSDSCWDLNAIVRSCHSTNDTTITTTTTTIPLHEIRTNTTTNVVDTSSGTSSETTLSILSSLKFEEEDDQFLFQNLVKEPNNGFDELHDCLKQFFHNNNNNDNNPISSSTPVVQDHQHQHQQQQPPPPLPPVSLPTKTSTITALAAPTSSSLFVFGDPQLQNQQPPQPSRHVQPSRSSRKRKTPQKRTVCHVTEENLSSDFWAWRKYGQKPIKGSPYPRNYYRCSSSKGCGARKQVERSNKDPSLFIVSYTGDHTHPRPTHRNSLAGSSRSKFPRTQNHPVAEAANPVPHPSAAEPMAMAAEVALAEEEKTDAGEFYEVEAGAGSAEEEIDDDDLLIPNPSAAFNEDPFFGLDELHVRNSSSSGGSGGG